LDKTLKLHLEQSTVFKGLSKIIQNEMLECMLFVIRQNIKNEIKHADFFSVISDETTDVLAQFQMSIIFVLFYPIVRQLRDFGAFLIHLDTMQSH